MTGGKEGAPGTEHPVAERESSPELDIPVELGEPEAAEQVPQADQEQSGAGAAAVRSPMTPRRAVSIDQDSVPPPAATSSHPPKDGRTPSPFPPGLGGSPPPGPRTSAPPVEPAPENVSTSAGPGASYQSSPTQPARPRVRPGSYSYTNLESERPPGQKNASGPAQPQSQVGSSLPPKQTPSDSIADSDATPVPPESEPVEPAPPLPYSVPPRTSAPPAPKRPSPFPSGEILPPEGSVPATAKKSRAFSGSQPPAGSVPPVVAPRSKPPPADLSEPPSPFPTHLPSPSPSQPPPKESEPPPARTSTSDRPRRSSVPPAAALAAAVQPHPGEFESPDLSLGVEPDDDAEEMRLSEADLEISVSLQTEGEESDDESSAAPESLDERAIEELSSTGPDAPGSPPLAVGTAGSLAGQESRKPPPPRRSGKPSLPATKIRRRPWWETLFGDDFARAHRAPSKAQLGREVDFMISAMELGPGQVVLDLGCGQGEHSVEMSRRGFSVVGYDLSVFQLAMAGDRAQAEDQKINFLQGDMREMAFEAMFDGIVCWNTTFGYFEEEKNQDVAKRILAALRPGGSLLLMVMNRDFAASEAPTNIWFEGDGCVCMDDVDFDWITSRLRVKRSLILDDGRSKELHYSMRLYNLSEIGKLLHGVGFRVVQVSGNVSTPGAFFGPVSPYIIIRAQRA